MGRKHHVIFWGSLAVTGLCRGLMPLDPWRQFSVILLAIAALGAALWVRSPADGDAMQGMVMATAGSLLGSIAATSWVPAHGDAMSVMMDVMAAMIAGTLSGDWHPWQ